MHKPPYAGHPGYQKMITTLRKQFFWPNLKTNLVDYLSKCLECQQVKDEHQHTTGLLQPLPIPEWKWEVISLDFITGFPLTLKQHDSINQVYSFYSSEVHLQGFQCCKNISKGSIPTSWSTKDGNFTRISNLHQNFGSHCLQG